MKNSDMPHPFTRNSSGSVAFAEKSLICIEEIDAFVWQDRLEQVYVPTMLLSLCPFYPALFLQHKSS